MKRVQQRYLFYPETNRATLLIPGFIYPFFIDLLRKEKKTRVVIHRLLQKYFKYESRISTQFQISSTTQYQEKGLDLHKVDFHISKSEWVQMKLLAGSFNLSICAFFVLLLKLEMSTFLDVFEGKDVVPSKFPKISSFHSITLYSIPQFTRVLHLRV